MSQRTTTRDPRGRRVVAPIGLVLAVAIIAATAWRLGADLHVTSVTVPVDVPSAQAGAIPVRGTPAFAILRTDTLSEDAVELLEAITNQSATVAGISRVRSVTNIGVLTTLPPGVLASTPAFGSASELPSTTDLETRARTAAAGPFGTEGLLSSDGHTLLVSAEVDPTLPLDQQDAAARSFRDRASLAVAVSGLPVTVSFGGEAFTAAEATDGVRTDLALLVGLACLAPAAITLVILRRRVPAGALLAAGGAALLLASLLVNGEATQRSVGALDRDHPVSVANALVDQDLRGTVPITIDVTGAPGAFRRPDVLARMDALTTWLRDEYGVTAIDLPTTLRAEAGAITGVDSIPSNPDDIASLLDQTASFDDGRYLADIANQDLSRTRIVAWLPDEGRARLDELAGRLDRIAVVVFDDLGISAQFSAEVVSPTPTRQSLANDLALLGMISVALGGLVALAAAWDRHRHEERHRERHHRLFGAGGRHPASSTGTGTSSSHDDHRWNRSSLFARHSHEHGHAREQMRQALDGPDDHADPAGRDPGGREREPDLAERFAPSPGSGPSPGR